MSSQELPSTTPPAKPTVPAMSQDEDELLAGSSWETEFAELEYRFLQLRRSLAMRLLQTDKEGEAADRLRFNLQDALKEVRELRRSLENVVTEKAIIESKLAASSADAEELARENRRLEGELGVARLLLGETLKSEIPEAAPKSGPQVRQRDAQLDTQRPPRIGGKR